MNEAAMDTSFPWPLYFNTTGILSALSPISHARERSPYRFELEHSTVYAMNGATHSKRFGRHMGRENEGIIPTLLGTARVLSHGLYLLG